MKKLKKWFASLFPNEVHVIFPLVRDSKESHKKLLELIDEHMDRGDELSLTIYPIENESKELKALRHYHDTTVGLFCIDQEPDEVSYEWIKENAFELEPISSYSKIPERINQSLKVPSEEHLEDLLKYFQESVERILQD